jgi:16S rRNA (cytosine967-C5)-methyltransferase
MRHDRAIDSGVEIVLSTTNARQLAWQVLKQVQRGAFADVALDRVLANANVTVLDRKLATELVYGSIRRQRTLDALIDQLAQKPAKSQPPELRLILHLGLYQLRYLDHIPSSAAVNTTVDLAKQNGFSGLAGFVNGLLRQYLRSPELLVKTDDPIAQIGIQHSYPDWIVKVYLEQFGQLETEHLCEWFNQVPSIDLRVNTLKTSIAAVETQMHSTGVQTQSVPHLPQALRFVDSVGNIQNLPGFANGEWIVQDSSAQLVGYLLDPQPGETIVDACAAPGGKTLHMAELMQDQGTVWAVDRTISRLKKLQQNVDRLGFSCIQVKTGDSRDLPEFVGRCDRVLVDAPCSGLGTLHRHADARWRQTPESVAGLAEQQLEILQQAATWVKPEGRLVYATCTLHPQENEAVIRAFLQQHGDWQIDRPASDSPVSAFVQPEGWAKVLPHQHQMDGFFMVRLRRK